MSQQSGALNPFDPFGTFRVTRDTYMEAWSRAMLDFVNSEAYTEASSRMLDSYLTLSIPLRKLVENSMEQVLVQLNMPTRADVTSVAERLTNIEMRLDDLDAQLDSFRRDSQGRTQVAAPESAQSTRSQAATRTRATSRTQAAPRTSGAARTHAAPRTRAKEQQ